MSRIRVLLAAAVLMTTLHCFAAEPSLQNRLLNPLDQPSFPGMGAWEVDNLSASIAKDIQPQIGSAAIEISGDAKVPGSKADVPAYDGTLPACRRITLWAAPTNVGNIASVGIQVCDTKGEWLLQTVDVDWQGWKQVNFDLANMRQAYPQDGNSKADLPLRSVHLIWFAKSAGPASMVFDSLAAAVDPGGEVGVSVITPETQVIDPGTPLSVHAIAENRNSAPAVVSMRYTLQTNPTYLEPVMPIPGLGFDHAQGAKTTVSVDGVDKGDALFCDGNDFTGFETPWGSSYKEAVALMDLGQVRNIKAVRWQAGDANWINKCDVLASTDGEHFSPVPAAQGVVMKAKWAGPHSFPWPEAVAARYLRFRFHNDGEGVNCIRLPVSIMVYDGDENDKAEMPTVGEVVATGSVQRDVKANDFADLAIRATQKLAPGAYLLALDTSVSGKHQVRLSHLLVRPSDEVPADKARRFGINGSNTSKEMANDMRRVGFGWMRYENGKWQMYMPDRDKAGFTGTTAPWNLNFDQIFGQYQQVGLKVLPYVFQPPQWATSAPASIEKNREGYPPKDPADYADAIFQLVARYGRNKVDPSLLKSDDRKTGLGLIDAVELWNEPNLNDPGWGPFVGTMPQYFDVMRAGVEGARRADPSLPITAGGLAGIDLKTVGLLSKHHYADGKTPLDLVDVVNVHFYSGREDPETAGWDPNVDRNQRSTSGTTYPEQLDALVAWRDQLKPKAEIWLTETGNDVGGPIGLTERHQAAKLPRDVMIALAAGIDRVFIYREAGSTPSMHAGAGLLRNDGSTRPSWLTVATMIRQLQGFNGRAVRLSCADPKVWALLWEEGDRRLVTAWTLGEPTKLGMDLGGAEACDAFGHPLPDRNAADLPLSYFPIYIKIVNPGPRFAAIVSEARPKRDPARPNPMAN